MLRFVQPSLFVLLLFIETSKVVSGLPDWYPRIDETFSNETFPLRRCFKRENTAPTHGSGCGPKSKTCFFGDQACDDADAVAYPYPSESCTCNGTSSNSLGTWVCQPEVCPATATSPPEEPPCRDAELRDVLWRDLFGASCQNYEQFNYCIPFGDSDAVQNLTGNIACCTCGGGVVDPVTSSCSDIPLTNDPPVPWMDVVGDNCSWYAERPQTRCIDFGNEVGSLFGLTANDACCACASVTPELSTCQDLDGWTTVDNRTCSDVTKLDCLVATENYGVVEACCKCELRAFNPTARTVLKMPTEPYTLGSCTSNSTRFNMCMKLSPQIAPQDLPLFSQAESTWSSIILQDSPEFSYNLDIVNTTGFVFEAFGAAPQNISGLNEFYETICGFDPGFPADSIDDINLCVTQRFVNPSILGSAATVFGDNFARFGLLAMNANSIGSQRGNTSTVLLETIVHEIGHILGIGTIWETNATGQFIVNSADCSYNGESANQVYQELSGCSENTTLPIQFTEFSDGSLRCGAHLQEQCFGAELMSPAPMNDESEALSIVTVAMLEDLGYAVDYSRADPAYTKDNLNASCVCEFDDGSTTNRMLDGTEDEDDQSLIEDEPPTTLLSDKGRATVLEYAEKELEKMNELAASFMLNSGDEEDEEDWVAVGVIGITVMYVEDGHAHSMYVPNR